MPRRQRSQRARFRGPDPSQRVAPAERAYSPALSELMGSHSQRVYALLAGLGLTDLDSCSDAAMARLARDQVPDPAVLMSLAQGSVRSSTNILAVLNRRCRPLPMAPCPRSIVTSQHKKPQKP